MTDHKKIKIKIKTHKVKSVARAHALPVRELSVYTEMKKQEAKEVTALTDLWLL